MLLRRVCLRLNPRRTADAVCTAIDSSDPVPGGEGDIDLFGETNLAAGSIVKDKNPMATQSS